MTIRRRTNQVVRNAAIIALAAIVSLAGCTKDVTPGADTKTSAGVDLPASPTSAQIAQRTGLSFPTSMQDFRLVNTGDAVDISFNMAANEVDTFASGSGLTLTDGGRVIRHSSPVFEQNPAGGVSSGTITKDSLRADVEVASTGGSRVTVRVAISNA